MIDKLTKFINVTKRDGFLRTVKKSFKYIKANYLNKINIRKRIKYFYSRSELSSVIDDILNEDYDRILVWRGSFGWNVPLWQRPQQIANCLTEKKTLILYEVTRMTDDIDFIKKEKDNLYLVNYELNKFEKMLFEKLKKINKSKYLHLYSTCWDVKKETLDKYVNNGFKLLYEYIDDLNPVLAGTNKLPKNVQDIHNYMIDNKDVLVVTSADELYKDIVNKRKTKKNLILSTNGADVNHFYKEKYATVTEMESIKKKYKTTIGYYGALASWFDYDLVKRLAIKYPDVAFVLIGIKYDTSFDESKISDIKNVVYLGPIDYKDLPDYGNYFDIAWIPFVINDITLSTNPIKVFEYMALKKYIITSDLPECTKYKSVNIAKTYDDYINLIDNYKKLYTNTYKKLLLKEAKENSWEHKADEIIDLLKKGESNEKN